MNNIAYVNGGVAVNGLWHNRDWRLLWLGQAVSLTGDSMFDITIMLWVATVIEKGQSWAPAAASGVLIAAALPVLTVGPVAGVFVDRWNRRHTMMAADAFRAVLIASMLAVPALGHVSRGAELTAVYAGVALESAAAQFFGPSRLATLGRVVTSAEHRAKAGGLLQATGSLAVIIGEPLAAPLLFAAGVRWALAIDALSFAGSFLAVRAMRVTEAPGDTRARTGFRREFAAGARFFATSRVMVALCGGVMIATLGTGALNSLEVFFVTGNLHTAARWLGVLSAAVGAGAVLGALAGGWLAGRAGAARVFCLGLIAGGVLLAVFSRMSLFPAATVIIAFAGLMFGALNATAAPLFLALVPQQLIGRVMAIFNPLQQAANITSMALAGFLASGLVHVGTIFLVSALLIIAAGFAIIVPLRGADAGAVQEPLANATASPVPGR